jgi:pimeloyl-ACP methyl ester carboxylesterase
VSICKTKNCELYYEEFGAGNRYILMGMQFVASRMNYIQELAEHYGFHAYVIRIRGYAPSTLIREDLGTKFYDTWAQDICDFADAMGIDKFFYTGHSHGAGIGWTICMNHPERLHAFFGSGAGPHKKDGKKTGSARLETINAAKSSKTWEPYAIKQATYVSKYLKSMEDDPIVGEDAKYARKQLFDFWTNMPAVSALLNPGKPFPECETEDELVACLHTIKVPTLLLGGSADNISSPELMVRSLNAVENSKLIIYSGVDHVDLPYKMAKEYARDIYSFCQERNLL